MASSAFALLLASRLFAMTDKAEMVDALFRDYDRPGSPGASVMINLDDVAAAPLVHKIVDTYLF